MCNGAYLKATGTEGYVTEEAISDMVSRCYNPGELMPEIIRKIGAYIWEEKKDEILAQFEAEKDEKLDLFEVTYTWKQVISAETEEDAISIARNNCMGLSNYKGVTEEYTAKRVEFISESPERR